MKKILNLALGVCAVGIASLALSPEASAATWSSTVYAGGGTTWHDGGVTGSIYTTATMSAFATTAANNNAHVGGYYIQCTNRSLVGLPSGSLQTWYGSATRFTYYCPSGSSLSSTYGWVWDN